MNEQWLAIAAKCRGQETCLFDGRDLHVDIEITNRGAENLSFPLEFLRKSGPSIRLVDPRTQADTYLPTNPPNPALLEKLTAIAPGESVRFEWVIFADELRQFGERPEVAAEISISAPSRAGARVVQAAGTATLHIAPNPVLLKPRAPKPR
ncbi:hypothetical protein [Lysobacter capsici]|uniref:hypothetical protein n=1 Tax=Lysobacter capsici TaxID=435897 RepID=UPI000BBB5D83|nr:hypothetical protein [Lysobacter capsici]ATE73052.1 hypothetical protein CNO08_17845 [Lysobacter capsici]